MAVIASSKLRSVESKDRAISPPVSARSALAVQPRKPRPGNRVGLQRCRIIDLSPLSLHVVTSLISSHGIVCSDHRTQRMPAEPMRSSSPPLESLLIDETPQRPKNDMLSQPIPRNTADGYRRDEGGSPKAPIIHSPTATKQAQPRVLSAIRQREEFATKSCIADLRPNWMAHRPTLLEIVIV